MGIKNKTRSSINYIVDETHRFNLIVESREIFLHSYIDNVEYDPGVEYRMANMFLKNMRILENMNSKPIVIHLHSVGGSWTEGMIVFDAIKNSQCPVIVITHGLASSMGSIIPQAADLRVTMPSCWWLIHEGTTDITPELTCKSSRSWINWENETGKQMMDIYISKCKDGAIFKNMTTKQVQNYIRKMFDRKEDWWLSAESAFHHGFCDAIFGTNGYENIEEIKAHVC